MRIVKGTRSFFITSLFEEVLIIVSSLNSLLCLYLHTSLCSLFLLKTFNESLL